MMKIMNVIDRKLFLNFKLSDGARKGGWRKGDNSIFNQVTKIDSSPLLTKLADN